MSTNNITHILRLTAFVVIACMSTNGRADTVALANGDRLTGTVTTLTAGKLLIVTEHMGTIIIPTEQVVGLTKAEPMRIKTADGAQYTGVLSNDGDNQVITTAEGAQPIAIASVSQGVENYITTAPAQTAWSTTADLGYTLTKGNSETESRAVHIDSVAAQGKFEHRAFAYWDSDEADGETTRETVDAGYDLRYYFAQKWYALGSIGFFSDELKEIDSRITLGAGLGYQVFKHSLASLSTDLGATVVIEELAGDSVTNPAIRWGLDYQRWLQPERIEYFYGHEALKILDSDRGEVYKVNTGLRLHLSSRWTANARVDLVHETDPPLGNDRTDLTYTFGVGLTF